MQQFPEWVPEGIIAYFNDLLKGQGGSEAPNRLVPVVGPEDVESLMYVMQSQSMEKAWNAISRRAKNKDPALFAEAILDVSSAANQLDRYPKRQDIKDLYHLATKVRDLKCELKQEASRILGMGWEMWRFEWQEKVKVKKSEDHSHHRDPSDQLYELLKETASDDLEFPSLDVLEQFAESFEKTASDMEKALSELTAYVGKPGMKEAVRTYVIRMLSEEIKFIYGDPLTEVVAATSSVMLDEEIESDLVRKLVKTHQKLKLAYWAR